MSEMTTGAAPARPLVGDLVTALALRDPRLVTAIVRGMRRALLGVSEADTARATISELLRQIERDCHTGAFVRARTTLMRHDALFAAVFQ